MAVKLVEKKNRETKTLPSSLADALLIMGASAPAGILLGRKKKEFGLGRVFLRLENVLEEWIFYPGFPCVIIYEQLLKGRLIGP